METLNRRKLNHIEACLDESVDLRRDSFQSYKLLYQAMPEIDLGEVATGAEFAGKKIAAPLIISSMTGGAGARFQEINSNLAVAAEELGIPLGLGSMKVLLNDEEALASYQLRDAAPTIPIIANLGLVSFNYGLDFEDIERIIALIQPDAFALHLNALQEVIQEGGDTDFRGLYKKLEELVKRCPIPIYMKECGGGIAPCVVERFAKLGLQYIDISGADGTSWSAVEGRLSADSSLGELFKDFGLPTAWILENLKGRDIKPAKIVASGGIRNGLQAAKALALGASYVAVARPFLLAATESSQAAVSVGRKIINELRTAMFLVGVSSLEGLNSSLLLCDSNMGSK